MMRNHFVLSLFVALAAQAAPASAPPAPVLVYSGDDIAAGPGTMTIRCVQGDRPLWELDLTRDKQHEDARITRFDDLTDRSEFSYAPPLGTQYSLFEAHNRGRPSDHNFTEVRKGPDGYQFSLRESSSGAVVLVNYAIHPATVKGTQFVATRTVVNLSGRAMGKSNPVSAGMEVKLCLNLGPYGDDPAGGKCRLSPCDPSGKRRHLRADGTEALYQVADNCDQRNPRFDSTGSLWGQAAVMNSEAARELGLAPGRTFRVDSDVVAYYPASTIGNVMFDNRAAYLNALVFALTPREWLGASRDDHNVVGIPADGTVTKTFTLTINISARK